MAQEGAALHFSGESIPLDLEDLEFTRAILEPLRQSEHGPTNFSALYGDEAAKSVGYAPLGRSSRAGFALALEECQQAKVLAAI